MNFLLFVIFSSIEFFGLLYIGVVLFRIRLNYGKLIKLGWISVILSFASYWLNVFELSAISPLIQLAIAIVSYMIFFKFKVLYSLLVSLSSFLIFFIIQTTYLLILNYYNMINISDIDMFSIETRLHQLIIFVIVMLIFANMRRSSSGYAFVPDDPSRKISTYSNKLLGLSSSAIALLVFGMFYEAKRSGLFYSVIICFVIFLIGTIVLLFLQLKRDNEEFDVDLERR